MPPKAEPSVRVRVKSIRGLPNGCKDVVIKIKSGKEKRKTKVNGLQINSVCDDSCRRLKRRMMMEVSSSLNRLVGSK